MSTLTTFADFCRERAEWQPGPPRAACREETCFGTPKPAGHGSCGGHRCGCACHAPSDRDRALFVMLTEEIDAHTAPQRDLFGGESAEPDERTSA